MEELLYFLHTVFGQVDCLFLLINDKVSRLLDVFPHDGVHLGELAAGLAPFQLTRQNIAGLIQLCRLVALAGNNQAESWPRRSERNRPHR